MEETFNVKVEYKFTVDYKIKAKSKLEAETHALAHCSMTVGGGIHSSLPDDIVDWEANVHPDKKIIHE